MQKEFLYSEYDAGQKHPEIFRTTQGVTRIGIRPFFIPDDFRLYNEWVNKEINRNAKSVPANSFFSEHYFKTVLESTNAQSLWGYLDEEPSFEVDFYKAIHYHTPDQLDNIPMLPGDAMMQLIIAPSILADPKASSIVPACLEYLASGATRVFFVVDEDNSRYNQLAEQAGPVLKLSHQNGKNIFIYILAFGKNIR